MPGTHLAYGGSSEGEEEEEEDSDEPFVVEVRSLRKRYAMASTEIGCSLAMCGTDLASGCDVRC